MNAPYEGLEKIKRGEYKYKVAGLYVTIKKVDDKLWKLTMTNADPFKVIKGKLPKLFAFKQAMSLVKVEAKTLYDIWRSLARINDLLAKKAIATNPALTENQLGEAPAGSKVDIPHIGQLGDLSQPSVWKKDDKGYWRPRGRSSVHKTQGASSAALVEWSEFGDATLELHEGEVLKLSTVKPRIRIGNRTSGISKIMIDFSPDLWRGAEAGITLHFDHPERNPVRYTIPANKLPDLMIPNGGKGEELTPEMVKAEAMGCTIRKNDRGPLECVSCGRIIQIDERYLYDPRLIRYTCMSCGFPTEEQQKAKADPMARLADAMERIAKTQEKMAKETKYDHPHCVMMRRF